MHDDWKHVMISILLELAYSWWWFLFSTGASATAFSKLLLKSATCCKVHFTYHIICSSYDLRLQTQQVVFVLALVLLGTFDVCAWGCKHLQQYLKNISSLLLDYLLWPFASLSPVLNSCVYQPRVATCPAHVFSRMVDLFSRPALTLQLALKILFWFHFLSLETDILSPSLTYIDSFVKTYNDCLANRLLSVRLLRIYTNSLVQLPCWLSWVY